MRCTSCGGYSFDSDGRCKYCHCKSEMKPESKPPSGFIGYVSPTKLAEALAAKKEKERRESIPQLSKCPTCKQKSLFYDIINDKFECLNLECAMYSNQILPNDDRYTRVIDNIENPLFENVIFPDFSNPLYLSVKMLLADAMHIINRKYHYPEHICSDFAKEVIEFMTDRETRCGYVVIRFDNGEGHAIVAFETDYGLVYFEPQSGDQEYPQIGKPYRCQLEGVPENSIVTELEIKWNC